DDRGPLRQERAEGERRRTRTHLADLDDASAHGERVDVASEVVAPHDVEDDVDPTATGEVPGRLGEVLAPVVDGEIRTELPAAVDLGRARGHDDARPEGSRDLDRRGADTRRAGVDEGDTPRGQPTL